jgi:hypothetical protein
MTRLAIVILALLLPGCATLRPILTDCAAPAVKRLVASNLDRGFRALAGESGAWDTAVGDLVAELGGAGVCVITKLAATLPGSQPQAAGELAAPTDRRRDLAGQRARDWLRANRYEVPQ